MGGNVICTRVGDVGVGVLHETVVYAFMRRGGERSANKVSETNLMRL